MKAISKKYLILVIIAIIFIMMPSIEIMAQCPMCRAAAETNLAQGGTEGKGLNKGILYMLTLPYLLVGTLGFLWWKNKKGESETV